MVQIPPCPFEIINRLSPWVNRTDYSQGFNAWILYYYDVEVGVVKHDSTSVYYKCHHRLRRFNRFDLFGPKFDYSKSNGAKLKKWWTTCRDRDLGKDQIIVDYIKSGIPFPTINIGFNLYKTTGALDGALVGSIRIDDNVISVNNYRGKIVTLDLNDPNCLKKLDY